MVRVVPAGSHTGMKLVMDAFRELLFPALCACCGGVLADGELRLCEGCRRCRLERAETEAWTGGGEILPHFIAFREALWQFDAAGNLRRLLHRLKYGRDYLLGVDAGTELGRLVRRRVALLGLEDCFEPLLVAVPLHHSRLRRRGYNQAAAICEGVARSTGWGVLEGSYLSRLRSTRSQTGLDADSRSANLQGAFSSGGLRLLPQELPVIIDDVYTTGATVSELAGTLRRAGAGRVGIATLVQA